MTIDLRTFWKHWKFSLVLAALLIGYEMAMAAMLLVMAPAGQKWLGPLIFNAADHAVYLNYLEQGRNSFLISDLYNNLPQTPRFDVLWSFGGLLVRAGSSPALAHEILRWLCTLALAMAIYATAKTLADDERRARLISLLMLSGLSLGWIYAAWRDLGGPEFATMVPTPPDLVTEFGTAPILLGGAHIILSTALLLLVMRWLYELICLSKINRLVWTMLAIAFFAWLHPYFIALIGCQIAICLLNVQKNIETPSKGVSTFYGHFKKKLFLAFLVCLALVPATAYYLWLALSDAAFSTHEFQVNRLDLGSPWVWLIVLMPLLWAASRLLLKRVPKDFTWPRFPTWAVFWIISAVICLILPFPWKRKYTQGLLMVGVILTLPYWLMLAESLKRSFMGRNGIKKLLRSIFVFLFFTLLATASYWYLFQIQIDASKARYSDLFYKSDEVFAAWHALESMKPGTVIADDLVINLWTPVYSDQHVWLGHAHETPNYVQRYYAYDAWRQTKDPNFFNAFLDYNRISYVLVTQPENSARFAGLFDPQHWKKTFEKGSVSVWSRY